MTNSCADSSKGCNCDKNDLVWRKDSGLFTDKSQLSVKQLRFGDTSESGNKGTTHWENGNVMAQHEFDTTLYANYVQKWTAALT